MKKFLRRFHYGEKGFTLIELLVVVAILGVLAAVIVPNVGKFMGTGTVQAANTEAHSVQTAVLAYMADNSVSEILPEGGTVGTGKDEDIGPVDPLADPPGTTVKSFITGDLQAVYTISMDGSIVAATTANVTDSKWGDLNYTAGVGWAP